MIKDPAQDHLRMSAYPNLEYGNLYNALAMLLDVAHNIQFGLNSKEIVEYLKCWNFINQTFFAQHLVKLSFR